MWSQKRFAEKTLICIGVFLLVFTAWNCASFILTDGMEQTQLIESVFTVVGIECGGLLFKRVCDKIFVRKKGSGNDDANSS